MSIEITQLEKKDFREAMDFMNMVFSMEGGKTDFPRLLPVYYKPTDSHMMVHHVIRIDGHIRALVGIYPGTMIAGYSELRVARIGGVSVHPDFRKQNLMSTLMDYCMEIVDFQGFDLAVLGGDRHRYQYFGFEKCASRVLYSISKQSVKHSKIDTEAVEIRWMKKNEPEITAYLKKLHDRQVLRFVRDEEKFFEFCKSWGNKLFVIFKKRKPVGYFVASKDGTYITEIHGETTSVMLEAIATYTFLSNHEEISVSAGLLQEEFHQKMGILFESSRITDESNWHIVHWEKVLSALLRLKYAQFPMRDGKVVIGIKGHGTIKLQLKSGAVICKQTREVPAFIIDPDLAVRLFFGPLPPTHVIKLPKDAWILNQWFPLPLYISAQDMA